MHRFSALELIELNEAGAHLGPASRAILLLAASGAISKGDAQGLSLGARERWLLALRAVQFGPVLELQHSCGHCAETVEFRVTAADLGLDGVSQAGERPCRSLGQGDQSTIVGAVTAGDLVAIEAARDAAEARQLLRARVAPDGAFLSDDELDRVLGELDPEAEITFEVACPHCAARQDMPLDLATFFWREIELRIPRLLQQVVDLARAFHWNERDILALPPARRRFYLTAVGA